MSPEGPASTCKGGVAAAPALGTARHSPPNRAFLPPVLQGAPGTTTASPKGSKPMELPAPPGGEHRARWLAAVHCRSIEDSCRSGAHAWCSQPWPAPPAVPPTSTKHAVRAHRPVQCTRPGRRVGASSVSGRRPEYLAVAPRSGRGQPAPATGSAATIPIVHPRGKESFLPFFLEVVPLSLIHI